MARIKPQALLIQSKKKKVPSRISATTIVLCTSIVALMILLFSTYRHWSRRSKGDQTGTLESVFEDTNAFIDSKKYDIPGYAILNTSKGPVVVELLKDGSPQIVDKFIDLCQKEYFKGMPFNHVIKNFVIHGGNSEGLGAAEDWTYKGKLHGQLATSPKHEAFMLGTSKSRDRKVFELYITTAPIPDLNDKLLVFGRVVKGEDVVQEIEEVDTDEHYQPKSTMRIINIILKRELQG